jgi:hypothetical protein
MDVKDKATPIPESEVAAVKLSRFYKILPNEESTVRYIFELKFILNHMLRQETSLQTKGHF